MVRLKAVMNTLSEAQTEFQFHNGTIKSKWRTEDGVGSVNFNSTMVRLKAAILVLLQE